MIKIYRDNDFTYRFSLKAESGHTLLNSIPFSEQKEMQEIIKKLGSIQLTRNHFERKTNHQGKFLFNLKDTDGNTIGHSELYDSEAGMENGIRNLRERLKSLISPSS